MEEAEDLPDIHNASQSPPQLWSASHFQAMAVLARVESSSDATGTVSAHVAASTVAGMVFGILGFFGIVIAYQFLPRKGKKQQPSPQLRAMAPPAPKPIPLLTQLRTRCTTFFTSLVSKARGTEVVPDIEGPSATRTHKSIRSFHLTPERKREQTQNRKKFAKSLRLSITIPKSFPSLSPRSPRAPRHFYSKLGDSEAEKSLLKPDTALLSPWSPSELDYPTTPTTPNSPNPISPFLSASPLSPLPLYSPPPAYGPLSPQRVGFKQVDDNNKMSRKNSKEPKAVSPFLSASEVEGELDLGTKSLIEEVQSVLEYTRDWSKENEHRFVISDVDEDSEAGSLYSQPL